MATMKIDGFTFIKVPEPAPECVYCEDKSITNCIECDAPICGDDMFWCHCTDGPFCEEHRYSCLECETIGSQDNNQQ